MELASQQQNPGEPRGPQRIPPPPGGDDDQARGKGQGGSGGNDLEQAIAVLRARIDEEFKITERLDSKSRQAFALAAGFFAVVQTVAFGSFAQGGVNSGERLVLLGAAVLAGSVLIVVASRLADGEETLEEDDVRPEAIVEWCDEAGNDPEYVQVRLVQELSKMARSRATNNATRETRYRSVATAMRLSLIVVGLELVAAIVVRV